VPVAHVEAPAVPRADDLVAHNLTIAQWTIVMGAYVGNGPEMSRQVEQDNPVFTDLQEYSLAIRDVLDSRNFKITVGGGIDRGPPSPYSSTSVSLASPNP